MSQRLGEDAPSSGSGPGNRTSSGLVSTSKDFCMTCLHHVIITTVAVFLCFHWIVDGHVCVSDVVTSYGGGFLRVGECKGAFMWLKDTSVTLLSHILKIFLDKSLIHKS